MRQFEDEAARGEGRRAIGLDQPNARCGRRKALTERNKQYTGREGDWRDLDDLRGWTGPPRPLDAEHSSDSKHWSQQEWGEG